VAVMGRSTGRVIPIQYGDRIRRRSGGLFRVVDINLRGDLIGVPVRFRGTRSYQGIAIPLGEVVEWRAGKEEEATAAVPEPAGAVRGVDPAEMLAELAAPPRPDSRPAPWRWWLRARLHWRGAILAGLLLGAAVMYGDLAVGRGL